MTPHAETPPEILDCCGLRCPLPILYFRKAVGALEPGKKILLLSDDPNTRRDFADFCRTAGYALVSIEQVAEQWQFLVQTRGDVQL